MKEELKPCPFCGGEAKVHFVNEHQSNEGYYSVGCGNCRGTQTTPYCGVDCDDRDDAVRIWNTRSGPAWQDKPTARGMWVVHHVSGVVDVIMFDDADTGKAFRSIRRCYGPIPSDEAGE